MLKIGDGLFFFFKSNASELITDDPCKYATVTLSTVTPPLPSSAYRISNTVNN